MTNHQTPPHPENRRLNTQLMLPDTFLTISSDFMKFCDFSKISKSFDFFASKPWDRIRRCHWTASKFQDAKTFNPRYQNAANKNACNEKCNQNGGVGVILRAPTCFWGRQKLGNAIPGIIFCDGRRNNDETRFPKSSPKSSPP